MMVGRWTLVALIVLLTPALAGCLGDHAPPSSTGDYQAGEGEPDSVTVVLGFADSGINPYHVAFRDPSSQAYQHPSTYIEGYPTHALALNLTFDASDYDAAVAADEDVWSSLEEGELYWVPGTRIVGGIVAEPPLPGECPLLDCHGHGTFVASRGAGIDLGLCPECKIVMAQGFEGAFEWLAEAAWVDVSSNAFVDSDRIAAPRAETEALMAKKPTFFSSGNGVEKRGVVGAPAVRYHHQGLPSVIAVGGEDNGRIALWPGSMPHVVADACPEGADWTSFDGLYTRAGTSHSTPYAAGAAGHLVLHARAILGGDSASDEPGAVARGNAGNVSGGPLADGDFTVEEVKRLLLATADARPTEGQHDGDACELTRGAGRFGTLPIEWQTIPDDVPAYYFIGYGAINNDTLEHATRVLRGEEPMPERPVEDAFFASDQEVRKALVEVDP